MKIILLEQNIDIMGGVERVISTLANNFSKNNEVYVISENRNNDLPFFQYDENVQIRYLCDKRNSHHYTNPIISKVVDYYNFRFSHRIIHFINNEIENILSSADVIIFGRVDVALDFLPYFKKKKNNAKIIVRDAINLKLFKKWQRKKMLKYFPMMVNYFVVSSQESINDYELFFINRKKMKIVKIYNPLGIIPDGKYNYNRKTVISLGRFDKQKGFENLIMAFKDVVDKYGDWKLVIYGDGPIKNKLRSLISELSLENNILLKASEKNIVKVLNNSSIYVMTSRYEGYANMLVEAMCCGMPVISYNWYNGVEDIIENGINGEIVYLKNRKEYFLGIDDRENIFNLSTTLKKMISNKKLCDKYSKNAKKIYNSRNIDTIIKKWSKLIEECTD